MQTSSRIHFNNLRLRPCGAPEAFRGKFLLTTRHLRLCLQHCAPELLLRSCDETLMAGVLLRGAATEAMQTSDKQQETGRAPVAIITTVVSQQLC